VARRWLVRPCNLAPEIFAGGRATPASDIYAVGVLLYHLLTGSYPIVGRTLGEIRERHRRSDRVALCARRADVPAALGDVINWALEIDPGVRFQTADEFARALSTIDPAADLVAVAAAATFGNYQLDHDRRGGRRGHGGWHEPRTRERPPYPDRAGTPGSAAIGAWRASRDRRSAAILRGASGACVW
jgi:serine/threonine protein kinase